MDRPPQELAELVAAECDFPQVAALAQTNRQLRAQLGSLPRHTWRAMDRAQRLGALVRMCREWPLPGSIVCKGCCQLHPHNALHLPCYEIIDKAKCVNQTRNSLQLFCHLRQFHVMFALRFHNDTSRPAQQRHAAAILEPYH